MRPTLGIFASADCPDGAVLTAAVSAALSANAVPCNMVAAFRHDHVFVPSAMAERALAILKALQAEAAGLL